MITRANMMKPMLAACPEFEPEWRNFLQEWKDENEPPLDLALSDLARHLITLLAAGRKPQLAHIFEVVERWIAEGDDHVRQFVMSGLLPTLQNESLHHFTKPQQFEPFLRPETRTEWIQVASAPPPQPPP